MHEAVRSLRISLCFLAVLTVTLQALKSSISPQKKKKTSSTPYTMTVLESTSYKSLPEKRMAQQAVRNIISVRFIAKVCRSGGLLDRRISQEALVHELTHFPAV